MCLCVCVYRLQDKGEFLVQTTISKWMSHQEMRQLELRLMMKETDWHTARAIVVEIKRTRAKDKWPKFQSPPPPSLFLDDSLSLTPSFLFSVDLSLRCISAWVRCHCSRFQILRSLLSSTHPSISIYLILHSPPYRLSLVLCFFASLCRIYRANSTPSPYSFGLYWMRRTSEE